MRFLVPLAAAAALALILWFRPGATAVSVPASPAWQTSAPAGRAPLRASGPALVYVAGEVRSPGVYALAADARVRDAVEKAGGMRSSADPVAVNLAAHVADGDEIVVPPRGAAASARAARSASHGGRRAGGARHARKHGGHHGAAAPPALVDLNRADAQTLATLPGVGPGLAERIIAFRDANGAFASPDELLDVAGFTERRLDAVLPYVVAR